MTASQKAMLLAMEYPDPEKGGRGKTVEIFNGFDPAQLSKARKIVKWAPELITGVMGGAVIRAAAERRLADEYDAAQERGEVAGQGGNRGNQHAAKVPDGNVATAADIGLSRKDIHEARQIRDAEKAEPITPLSERERGQGAGLARSADP